MNKTGIFYATISRNTKKIATMIAIELDIPELHIHNLLDIEDIKIMNNYDLVICGTPTYGKGDVHYLWREIFQEMQELNFNQKRFAIFCLGDEVYHKETFAGSLRIMYSSLNELNIILVGECDHLEYETYNSDYYSQEGKYPGLIVDEVNQSDKTLGRIAIWCKLLMQYT